MKMNLCYKNLEPFGNLADRNTFFDESRLEIILFVKRVVESATTYVRCNNVLLFYCLL